VPQSEKFSDIRRYPLVSGAKLFARLDVVSRGRKRHSPLEFPANGGDHGSSDRDGTAYSSRSPARRRGARNYDLKWPGEATLGLKEDAEARPLVTTES
jgi:hypothetical protein